EGIDVKKPIGLYANVKTSLNESEVVLLLPIADEKTFLDFLGALNLEPKKDKDDLYTLKIENVPVPVLFRFAHGYLYAAPRLNSKVAPAGKEQGAPPREGPRRRRRRPVADGQRRSGPRPRPQAGRRRRRRRARPGQGARAARGHREAVGRLRGRARPVL